MGFDFKMVFANSDGSLGAMCGNGGRCIVHFADRVLKIIKNKNKIKFLAADGTHEAKILKNGLVKLKMQDVKEVQERNGLSFVYSGTTPHNVMYVKDLENFPVFETGKKIRYGDPDGVNVNFVEKKGGILNIRTYERGVEDETLACGTGACSVAVVSHFMGFINKKNCQIKMPGGKLKVEFKTNKDGSYIDVWLTGPAVLAFKGEVV
jgi:diaminopimelate epimerase